MHHRRLGGSPKDLRMVFPEKHLHCTGTFFFQRIRPVLSLSLFFFFSKTDLVNSNKGMVKKKVLLFSFSSFG